MGTCTVTKSASAIRSYRSWGTAPSERASSGVRRGWLTMMCMPKAAARLATSRPMRPNPMIPRVSPASDVPMSFFLSHLPAFIEASAAGMWRARLSIKPIVCSATATVLASGAFTTWMPRALAVETSMLSRPAPARAITRRLGNASIISAVRRVRLRTTKASAFWAASMS